MNSPVASSVIITRSDWQSCIICTNKRYKKDGKLHKVEYCGKISRHGRSRTFDTLFSTNDARVRYGSKQEWSPALRIVGAIFLYMSCVSH